MACCCTCYNHAPLIFSITVERRKLAKFCFRWISKDEALSAYEKFNGRWYNKRQLSCQFTTVDNWKSAICGRKTTSEQFNVIKLLNFSLMRNKCVLRTRLCHTVQQHNDINYNWLCEQTIETLTWDCSAAPMLRQTVCSATCSTSIL